MRDGYSSDKGLAQLEEKMSGFELPQGYSMEFGGDNEERNDAFTSMVIPSILAIAMIYLHFGNAVWRSQRTTDYNGNNSAVLYWNNMGT